MPRCGCGPDRLADPLAQGRRQAVAQRLPHALAQALHDALVDRLGDPRLQGFGARSSGSGLRDGLAEAVDDPRAEALEHALAHGAREPLRERVVGEPLAQLLRDALTDRTLPEDAPRRRVGALAHRFAQPVPDLLAELVAQTVVESLPDCLDDALRDVAARRRLRERAPHPVADVPANPLAQPLAHLVGEPRLQAFDKPRPKRFRHPIDVPALCPPPKPPLRIDRRARSSLGCARRVGEAPGAHPVRMTSFPRARMGSRAPKSKLNEALLPPRRGRTLALRNLLEIKTACK